jgi:hypothetical protein
MIFFLGTHQPDWLGRTTVPLFVSYRRLADRRTLPRARGPWALDSGGFSELRRCGPSCAGNSGRHVGHGWRLAPEQYATGVRRLQRGIGRLMWAAPQDWMVEPDLLQATGLNVEGHQRLTVDNFTALRALGPDLPIIPVLQGWTPGDYLRCVGLYQRAGVDLRACPVVGVGSVCRRQNTAAMDRVIEAISTLGVPLHGFGVKRTGLARFGGHLASADSMAWSFAARRGAIRLPGCEHRGRCNNCLRFALRWPGNCWRRRGRCWPRRRRVEPAGA